MRATPLAAPAYGRQPPRVTRRRESDILTLMDGKADQEIWRQRYRAACDELARMWALELAGMSEQEALRRMESLVVAEPPWREREDWSGLVEQQAIFHRRRSA